MRNVWREESGTAPLLVLTPLAMGPLLLTPMLQFTFTAQKSGQIQTRILKEQYARDSGSEYALLSRSEIRYPSCTPTYAGQPVGSECNRA